MADCNFQHECEEFEGYNGEGENHCKFQACKKNPGHGNFKPVCDLKMDDIPPEFQTDEGMCFIQERCNRTVKLHLSYTSKDRPDSWDGGVPYPFCDYKGSYCIARCGTGYIGHIGIYEDEKCFCKECKNDSHPVTEYMTVEVWTARHVVFDDSEAVQTTVECFYDTPDKTGVALLYGGRSFWKNLGEPDNDMIRVFCYTHDKHIIDTLNKTIGSDFPRFGDRAVLYSGFTVSHPHGLHKQISFGHSRFTLYSIRKNLSTKRPGFVQCRLKCFHCTNNAPISQQCQEGRKDEEENKMYLENGTWPSTVVSGIEYILPDTSKICLPYHHRDLWEWIFDDDGWHDIPEGGGYVDSNGKLVYFPSGMEIWCGLEYQVTLIYDIPTCPGSSGARVFTDAYGGDILHHNGVHSGTDNMWGNRGFYGYLQF